MRTRFIFHLFAALCLAPMVATSEEAPKEKAVDLCAKDFLRIFFPEPFVKETLKKFNVPEAQWKGIIEGLNSKQGEVSKLVEAKAAALTPNPLKEKGEESRHATTKIFRESLLQLFSGVLKEHGVQDDKQIHLMLNDVQRQKAKNFAECIEKHRLDRELPSTSSSGVTDPKSGGEKGSTAASAKKE